MATKMKSTLLYILTAFALISCSDPKAAENEKYESVFGEWVVTDAKFIKGENSPAHLDQKGKELEEAYLRYHYRFFDDSTFERGKPTVRHRNVEEAHGRFSVDTVAMQMDWYVKFSTTDSTDTIKLDLISISPHTIVLVENMGGQNRMVHTLERKNKLPLTTE